MLPGCAVDFLFFLNLENLDLNFCKLSPNTETQLGYLKVILKKKLLNLHD